MGAEEPPELGEKLSGYWQYCWQYLAPSSRLCAQAVTQPGLVLASPRPKPKVCPSPVTWHGNGGPEGPNFQHTLSGYGNGRSLTSREKSKKHECNFALKRLAGRPALYWVMSPCTWIRMMVSSWRVKIARLLRPCAPPKEYVGCLLLWFLLVL